MPCILFNNMDMFMLRSFIFCAGLLLGTLSPNTLLAAPVSSEEPEDIIHWAQFSFENDALSLFNPSDDGYSNGLLYTWGRSNYNSFEALELPNWIRYISDWTYINQGTDKDYSLEYGVSQRMYTPDDLAKSEIVWGDTPYAGTLLWHTKIRHYGDNSANSLGLTLGVIGPASLAEVSQKVIHKAIGATDPKGWDNQINNEPVFRIEGEHIDRFYTHYFAGDLAFDSSVYSNIGVGNLRSNVGSGLAFRLGNMLDQTYASINPDSGTTMSGVTVSSTDKWYWQVFTTVYASYVFNDITLDGNTFTESYSVDLINEQAVVTLGTAAVYNSWGVAFTVHCGTDQFEEQQVISKYGSLTLSYRY